MKKISILFLSLVMVLSIVGCSNKEEKKAGPDDFDNPRNQTSEEFMPLSEGFEKYPVWMTVSGEEPVRTSTINSVFVFEEGKVKYYKVSEEKLTIEESLDMSDDEFLQFAKEASDKMYEEMEEKITSTPLNMENESHQEFKEEMEYYAELEAEHFRELFGEDLQPIEEYVSEDIFLEVSNERSESPLDYNLDIQLDNLGQSTQSMSLEIEDATYSISATGELATDYLEYEKIKTLPIYGMIGIGYMSKEDFDSEYKMYVERLEEYGSFKERDGYELYHPQNFLPNPLEWESQDLEFKIPSNHVVRQKIFDTTFAGQVANGQALITKVDDSFAGFILDGPDTKKDNVTIEKKNK